MRQVLVDTNVLVSALVFPYGTAGRAFGHVTSEERVMLTEWIVQEARDVVGRKWPDLIPALDVFLQAVAYEVLPVASSGIQIRDPEDQPILDAAIAGGVDIILTGDKDFLAMQIDRPLIVTPRMYLDQLAGADGKEPDNPR